MLYYLHPCRYCLSKLLLRISFPNWKKLLCCRQPLAIIHSLKPSDITCVSLAEITDCVTVVLIPDTI